MHALSFFRRIQEFRQGIRPLTPIFTTPPPSGVPLLMTNQDLAMIQGKDLCHTIERENFGQTVGPSWDGPDVGPFFLSPSFFYSNIPLPQVMSDRHIKPVAY